MGRGRRDEVEVYSQARFMICTGVVVRDRPVTPRHELLARLVSEMNPPASAETNVNLAGWDGPDYALAARAAADDRELGRLWAGDWQGRYPSQSEADLDLVKLLLPHTNTPRECWQTFRLSQLGQRDKAARESYARPTLATASHHLESDAQQVAEGRTVADAMFGAPQAARRNAHLFRLLSDEDLARQPQYRWFVKGIIPDQGIGTIFGQSGTFKSFLAFDLLAHVSNGEDWFGRRVNAAHAVYVPFEGQGGVPKRVAAWRLARAHAGRGSAATNMRFITEPMNLRVQADRDKLVATLVENGWAGGVLCIDTLAQAGPGIDENTSQGMGEMIAIFQELQQRLGGVVLVVHHSGKTEKAGMRGWSGLLGALDFAVRCWRGDEWLWYEGQFVLDKVKDGERETAFDFTMLRVTLGYDEDGDPITSLTLSPVSPEESERKPDDTEVAAADDAFVEWWVRKLMAEGMKPTGRWLDAQRVNVKEQRNLTQKRLRDAIDRLKGVGRLELTDGGPSGAKWLRAVDVAPRLAL